MFASEMGYSSVVDILLEKGAKVEEVGKLELTSMQLAMQNGHLSVMKRLLVRGARVREEDVDEYKGTYE